MNLTAYRNRYGQDIRNRIEITQEDLFRQLRNDFEINEESDIEYAKSIWAEKARPFIYEFMKNRVSESDDQIRITQEYYYRTRLASLFPIAYKKYLQLRAAEKLANNLKDPEFKEFYYKDYDQIIEEWTSKETRPRRKREEPDMISDVFGDLVTRVGGDSR